MISPYTFPLLLAVLVCQPTAADPIYKWVDSKGRVTYSSTPPPGGVKADQLKTPPAPTEEQVRQAEEQLKRTKEQASELESQRLKQEEKEAEEARLRKEQQPQPPTATEKPAYSPQPTYYNPPLRPPLRPTPRPLPK